MENEVFNVSAIRSRVVPMESKFKNEPLSYRKISSPSPSAIIDGTGNGGVWRETSRARARLENPPPRSPSLPPSLPLHLPPSIPLHLPRSTLLQRFRLWPSPAAFDVSRLAAPPIVSLNLEQSSVHLHQVRLPSSCFSVSIISPPASSHSSHCFSLSASLSLCISLLHSRRLPLPPSSLPHLSPMLRQSPDAIIANYASLIADKVSES
ncbi:hypothetical protein ACLOJK_009896 [Asimina triloba]